MRRRLSIAPAWALSLGLAVALTGCQGTGGLAKLHETLANLEGKQDEVLNRLAALEDKVGKAAAANPRARPNQKKRPNGPDPKATYKVDIGDAPAKGPKTAKVTIVEWSDFQCPYCSRVSPTLAQLQKDYGDDLRIVFKHNPLSFHKQALPAAVAAEAAHKQGKFWPMHDKLFANAKALTADNFVTWAGELGLDVDQFKKDLADPSLKKRVTEQQSQGMKLGARGTPAFFINGRFLNGAQPVDNFKKLIDEEMAKANKLIAGGTPVEKIYEQVIQKGKTAV